MLLVPIILWTIKACSPNIVNIVPNMMQRERQVQVKFNHQTHVPSSEISHCLLLSHRYLPGYPYTAPALRLHNQKNLAVAQTRALSKHLHNLAATYSKTGEVKPIFALTLLLLHYITRQNMHWIGQKADIGSIRWMVFFQSCLCASSP